MSFFLFLLLLTVAHARRLCSTLNPNCGLTPAQAQVKFLTPHADIIRKLRKIKQDSRVPIEVGPLIKNGDDGLIDIDVSLPNLPSAVNPCSSGNPTVREAVICTVTEDIIAPERGNTNPAKVGFSTQGRTLFAARLGNPRGVRVFIVTQQHGNEPASTEAALKVLRRLTAGKGSSRRILRKLNLLFAIRVNPDGGEPTANNNPPVGVPFNATEGFFRQNVDLSAGGGFATGSEEDFFGVVGRGYNTNRYNHARLDKAIRPVESQAIVAILHAFNPLILFDAHGDQPKAQCEFDPATLAPGAVLGAVPTIECKPPSKPVPTVLTDRAFTSMGGVFAEDASVLSPENTELPRNGPVSQRYQRKFVRTLAASVIRQIDPLVEGRFSRFSQLQIGSGVVPAGLLARAPLALGRIGSGWEVSNFVTTLRPAVLALNIEGGNPTPQIGIDTAFVEPCFLADNICLHELILNKVLLTTTRLVGKRLKGEGRYCSIPVQSGVVGRLPAALGWGNASVEDDGVIPLDSEFGVFSLIFGRCPMDSASTRAC